MHAILKGGCHRNRASDTGVQRCFPRSRSMYASFYGFRVKGIRRCQ
jgi:hypothetical protein